MNEHMCSAWNGTQPTEHLEDESSWSPFWEWGAQCFLAMLRAGPAGARAGRWAVRLLPGQGLSWLWQLRVAEVSWAPREKREVTWAPRVGDSLGWAGALLRAQ